MKEAKEIKKGKWAKPSLKILKFNETLGFSGPLQTETSTLGS